MIINHVSEATTPTCNVSQTLFKRGIIRFALFIEKTKIIQNLPNDPIDNSEIIFFGEKKVAKNSLKRLGDFSVSILY
jgi:hypothetical protein